MSLLCQLIDMHLRSEIYLSPLSRAKTSRLFAGITIVAEEGNPCIGPPFAQMVPLFPLPTDSPSYHRHRC